MNTNSPLIPQGTTPPRGKSSLYFKILMILTVHVVLIGGMLLQGCKDTGKEQAKDSNGQNSPDYAAATNTSQETMPPVNVNSLSNNQVATIQTSTPPPMSPPSAPTVQPQPVMAPPVTTPPPAVAPTTAGADYVIASGDTFAAIAKRQHISVKALREANPGVDARKLRVGQKIQLPGSSAVAGNSAAAPAEAGASDGSVYVVKTGDTLGKIARAHGTSYKKLMALNDLKTSSIRVGQKLKIPAPKPTGADVVPASASNAQPPTSTSAAPATTSAATTPAPASGTAN
jgi:LysM repeat protein